MSFKNRAIIRPYMPRGCNHYRARFTEEDVLSIRQERAGGMSYAEIGRMYEVRSDTIRNLCLGYTYANLGGPVGDYTTSPNKRRLDDRLVSRIREDYRNGMSFKKLCEAYQIGMVSAHRIVKES